MYIIRTQKTCKVLLFINQNADEKEQNVKLCWPLFFEKNTENMLFRPNYAESYASIVGKGLQENKQVRKVFVDIQWYHYLRFCLAWFMQKMVGSFYNKHTCREVSPRQ